MQRMLRRFSSTMGERWNRILTSLGPKPCGPFGYFFEQVHKLGWTVQWDGTVVDHDGIPWSVFADSWAMVHKRVLDAWSLLVTHCVRTDEQFAGLQPFSIPFIRKALTGKQQCNSLVANYTTGAILSTRCKQKILSHEASLCNLCKQPAGAVHLVLECPGTSHARNELDFSLQGSRASFLNLMGIKILLSISLTKGTITLFPGFLRVPISLPMAPLLQELCLVWLWRLGRFAWLTHIVTMLLARHVERYLVASNPITWLSCLQSCLRLRLHPVDISTPIVPMWCKALVSWKLWAGMKDIGPARTTMIFGVGFMRHSSQTLCASQSTGFLVTRSSRLMPLNKTIGVHCIMMQRTILLNRPTS